MKSFLIPTLICALVVSCGNDQPPPVATETTTQAVATSGANHTFAIGSLIIPADTTYQDDGAFLAYGLVYKLLQNNIPVSWVIKSGKRLSTIATSPSGATRAGTTATFTTTQAHNLVVGEPITIRNVGVAAYNGTWTVTAVTTTTFQVTLATVPSGASGGGTATPSDFVASATDRQGGPAITNYGYRGGPFVIDSTNAAAASPIISAWQTANPTTKVHTTTTAFTGFVKRQLVAAPTIAQFDDGNASIASAYLNAAKIPDSQGLAWTNTSVDLLSPNEVAGVTCAGTADCKATPHDDGGLFDANRVPAYCQMMTMHWAVNDADTDLGREVVREYRSFLKFPTHLYAECQAVNAIENNTNAPVSLAASPNGATASGTTATFSLPTIAITATGASEVGSTATFTTSANHGLTAGDTVIIAGVGVTGYNGTWVVATVTSNTKFTVTLPTTGLTASGGGTMTRTHNFAVGDSVLVAGVGVAGYNGTWVITNIPSLSQFRVTVTASGLAGSGGGNVASYNGLFLTKSGYLIGSQPADVDSYNYDQPYAQYDGYFKTTNGSEPAYTIPPGGGYKAQDVVMLTARPTPTGTDDVWMTGFLDGQCSTTQEFCDPSFAQGKVSYLGGHNYDVKLPISDGDSQGARLFLNALLEAPCATDLGVASLGLAKSAPLSSNGNQVTYSITAYDNSTSVAGNIIITDVLPAGASFVAPNAPSTITSIARATNVVTATTAAAHNLLVGQRVTVAGVTSSAFDGTFVITAIPSTTQVRWTQVGTNTTSSGGTLRNALDGICVGTASQCSGSGGGVVTFNVGALAGGQSLTVNVTVQFSTPAIYSNTAQASYKAGATTLTVTSNTTTTCYYAGNPSVCSTGCDPNAPACANGCDDDTDGLIDFPDDPGCDSGLDTIETNVTSTAAIKARVLIVFDTSGSMMWNTCGDDFTGGDGSQMCAGNDVLCSACGGAGCSNGTADDSRIFKVKAGIANAVNGFGEVEWSLMKFKQLPTQFSCGTLNVNRNDGGWQGAGGSPCSGFAAGDLVVKFDPENINHLLGYMDGTSNYAGTPPPGKDFELRATGNTPLAGSLASARTYIAQTRAADPGTVASCRPYQIILVTDGGETCAGDPVAQATSLFGTGDLDGQVPVHVIGFSTSNASVQTQLNQIAAAGGTTSYIQADNDAQLSSAIQNIVQGTILKELCNGLDDDCDGNVDEDFGDKDAVCSNGAKGACARAGTRVCRTDKHGTECDAVMVTCTGGRLIDEDSNDLGPCVEICNNADDNCNGQIDEGLTCNCQANSEICNGADDDCNGQIDDGVTGECTNCCVAACCKFDASGNCLEDCSTYQDVGECDFGDRSCASGGYVCSGYQGPTPEICDGLDNDCDGTPDDNAICPNPGDLCIAGECVFPCVQSEFPCPFGYACKQLPNCGQSNCNFCTPDPCLGKTCAVGFQCDVDDGQCHDLCEGNTCPSTTTCMNGYCLDCFSLGCPTGEKCVVAADETLGHCEADACATASCADGELCNAGTCTAVACTEKCAPDERCINGACKTDKCRHVDCDDGQVCKPSTGACETDKCTDVRCVNGEVCVKADGMCVPDPCALVTCPTDLTCHVTFDGEATCNSFAGTGSYLTVGGGGCSTSGGTSSAWIVGLALLALRRRRRLAKAC